MAKIELEPSDKYVFENTKNTTLKKAKAFISAYKNRKRRDELEDNIYCLDQMLKQVDNFREYVNDLDIEPKPGENYKAINKDSSRGIRQRRNKLLRFKIDFSNISENIEEYEHPNLMQIRESIKKDLEKQTKELEKQKEINKGSVKFLE